MSVPKRIKLQDDPVDVECDKLEAPDLDIKAERALKALDVKTPKRMRLLLVQCNGFEDGAAYKTIECNISVSDQILINLTRIYHPTYDRGPNVHYAMISYLECKYGKYGSWNRGDPDDEDVCDNFPKGELGALMEEAVTKVRKEWLNSHDYTVSFDCIEDEYGNLDDVFNRYIEYLKKKTASIVQVATFLKETTFIK